MVADQWRRQACLGRTGGALLFRLGVVFASLRSSGGNEPFGVVGSYIRERAGVQHTLFMERPIAESLEKTSCESGSSGDITCCFADSGKFRHLSVKGRFCQGDRKSTRLNSSHANI